MAATARQKQRFQNTLLCLLEGIVGEVTLIELRNESSVWGQIESVDDQMNVSVKNAVFTGVNGIHTKFTAFYVKGRMIRFVHIPESVDIMKTINSQLNVHKRVRDGPGKNEIDKETRKADQKITKKRQMIKLQERIIAQRLAEMKKASTS